jgi:hypothetical protein
MATPAESPIAFKLVLRFIDSGKVIPQAKQLAIPVAAYESDKVAIASVSHLIQLIGRIARYTQEQIIALRVTNVTQGSVMYGKIGRPDLQTRTIPEAIHRQPGGRHVLVIRVFGSLAHMIHDAQQLLPLRQTEWVL